MVIKSTNEKVPYFNAPIYLQNKSDVGKVDEIFGTIQEVYFSVKTMEGITATSFQAGDKLYINPEKLLPLQRFCRSPAAVAAAARVRARAAARVRAAARARARAARVAPAARARAARGSPGGRGFGKGGRGKG